MKANLLAELLWCPEPGDEACVGLLGHLAELPVDQPVGVDHEGDQVEEEAVPHVEDTADLGEDNPDEADPPEVQCSEGCSNDVAERAGEQVTNDVLDGVTWELLLSLRPAQVVA